MLGRRGERGADEKNVLLEGPILPSLLYFSVPVLLTLVLQTAYGTVDMIIVGHFGGTASINAVGTGSAIMTALTTVVNCFATGVSVTVGQAIGRDDRERAGRAIGSAMVLFAAAALLLGGLMVSFSGEIAALMNAPAQAYEKTVEYIRICSSGILFIFAYNAISAVTRGMGDSKLPMLFVAIACAANALADMLLVGWFRMDAAGAAIATVGAQALSVVLSLAVLAKRRLPIVFSLKSIRLWPEETKEILRVGFPLSVQSLLAKCSFLMINAWINDMGLLKAASYSVAEKLASVIMLVPSALMNSIAAFVAQNAGARKHGRAKKALNCGILSGGVLGLGMFCVGFFHSDILAKAFESDPAVIEQAALYMRGFSADCILGCVHFSLIGYLNGYGKTVPVMLQGITAAFLIRVPFSWWAAKMTGSLLFMGLATPMSTVYGILFDLAALWYYQKQNRPAGKVRN